MGKKIFSFRNSFALVALALLLFIGIAFAEYDDSIIAYWNFDNWSGTELKDVSLNKHDGVIKGAEWVPGYIEEALYFNKFEDDYGIIQHDENLAFSHKDSFTVLLWVFVPDTSKINDWETVLAKSRHKGNWWGLWLDGTKPEPKWVFGSAPSTDVNGNFVHGNLYAETPITKGWHYIALVQKGNEFQKIYVDNILEGTGIPRDANGVGNLFFGCASRGFDQSFSGKIDETRIFGKDLNFEEIVAVGVEEPTDWSARKYPAGFNCFYVPGSDFGEELEIDGNSITIKRRNNAIELLLPKADLKAYGRIEFEGAEIFSFDPEIKNFYSEDVFSENDGVEEQANEIYSDCNDDEVFWSFGNNKADFFLETCGNHDGGVIGVCYTGVCPKIRIIIDETNSETKNSISVGNREYESGEWIPLIEEELGMCNQDRNETEFHFECSKQDFVLNGVGLANSQPKLLEQFIPGNPKFSLFYWDLRGYQDNTAEIDGNEYIGQVIDYPEHGTYSYQLETTGLVSEGNNAFNIAGIGQGVNGGALFSLFDSSKTVNEVFVKGINNFFWYYSSDYPRHSETVSFEFEAFDQARTARVALVAGNTEAGERRENIWYLSGTSVPLGGIIGLGNIIASDQLTAADGPYYDTFEIFVEVPAGASVASFQIESPGYLARPDSILLTSVIFSLECFEPRTVKTVGEPKIECDYFGDESSWGNPPTCEQGYESFFNDCSCSYICVEEGNWPAPCDRECILLETKKADECWFVSGETEISMTVEGVWCNEEPVTYYRQRWKERIEDTWGEWSDWIIYEEPFSFSESSVHELEYYSVACDFEEEHLFEIDLVDWNAPVGEKIVGTPHIKWDGTDSIFYPEIEELCWNGQGNEMECWKITLDTPVTITCEDPEPHPVGEEKSCFRIEWDKDDITEVYCDENHYNGDFNVFEDGYCCVESKIELYFGEETEHNLKYYCVDALGNKGPVDDEKFKVEGKKFDIYLNKKWNLISSPVLPLDRNIEVVFSEISEKIDSVWTFDAFANEWFVFHPGSPETSNLGEIISGNGYWVAAFEDCVLSLGGSEFSPFLNKKLKAGWNMIGYFSKDGNSAYAGPNLNGDGKEAHCALLSLKSSQFDKGWTTLLTYWEKDNPNQWKSFEETDYMNPGAGYWISIPQNRTYTYSTNCGGT